MPSLLNSDLIKRIEDISCYSKSVSNRKAKGYGLGSDEHLDSINNSTKGLLQFIDKIRVMNDSFEESFPDEEDAGEYLSNLNDIYSGLMSLVKQLEDDDLMRKSYKSLIPQLNEEAEQVLEYISDLRDYRGNSDLVNLSEYL